MLPEGFVYIEDIDSSIQYDIKYAGNDNFVGRPINGYNANKLIMTEQAALALSKAQQQLKIKGLGLKVFDAYRPHSACQDFKEWSLNEDIKFKDEYYPTLSKEDLFNGYLAEFSSHSRGSTIDLTLIDLATNTPLDMGTIFDYLGELAHTENPNMPQEVQTNRQNFKNNNGK